MPPRVPGEGKINIYLNFLNHYEGIDKIFLYSKDTEESKYKLKIKAKHSSIFNMVISNKKELQKIAYNRAGDICASGRQHKSNERDRKMYYFSKVRNKYKRRTCKK